jgi:hypothetical protein
MHTCAVSIPMMAPPAAPRRRRRRQRRRTMHLLRHPSPLPPTLRRRRTMGNRDLAHFHETHPVCNHCTQPARISLQSNYQSGVRPSFVWTCSLHNCSIANNHTPHGPSGSDASPSCDFLQSCCIYCNHHIERRQGFQTQYDRFLQTFGSIPFPFPASRAGRTEVYVASQVYLART